jgi:hypothetical protein
MENETQVKMENETVYSKLRKAESLLKQIPEDAQALYKFKVFHSESDFVGIGFDNGNGHHIGFSVDVPVKIEIRKNFENFYCLDLKTPGIWMTLYCGGKNTSSHTVLL